MSQRILKLKQIIFEHPEEVGKNLNTYQKQMVKALKCIKSETI